MKLGFQIKAKDKKKAEVLIYEEIGESWFGGLSAKHFAEELAKLGKLDEINVRINSIGGSVFDGIAIYNTLRANGAKIVVDVDGLAASIASVIVMAGDDRRAAANSMFMIHDPWIMTMGTAAELRTQADLLDKIRGTLLDTYVRRGGGDETKISDMMAAETWFTAIEAQDLGFVHEITEDLKIAAGVRPEILAKFKHAPESLRALAVEAAFTPTPNEKIQQMRAKLNARRL
jgi:ATP-dependent Clp endopeptidase proteolytic subunit ClpP